MYFSKLALALLLLSLSGTQLIAQNWTPIGPVQALPTYGAEIMEAPNGDLWVGTYVGELYKYEGGTWVKKHDAIEEIETTNGNVPDYEIDSQGKIYLAFGYGDSTGNYIKVFTPSINGPGWNLKIEMSPIFTPSLDLCPDFQGNMYLGTTLKLYKVSGTTLDSVEVPYGFRPAVQENYISFSPSNQLHIVYAELFNGRTKILKRNIQQNWDTVASRPASYFTFSQLRIPSEGKYVLYSDKFISFDPIDVGHRIAIWENGFWTEPSDTLAIPSSEALGVIELDGQGNPIINTLFGNLFLYKNGLVSELPPYLPSPNELTYGSDIHYSFSREKLLQIWNTLDSSSGEVFSSIMELDLTLSTKEKMLSGLKTLVYPNPTEGTFQVRFDKENGDKNATLHNSMGREIWRGSLKSNQTVSVISQNFPSGIYSLRLESAGTFEQLKIVKK
jgi:hypothetical protein